MELNKHSNFIRLFTAVVAAHQSIADRFFADRVAKKNEQLLAAYLNVAQSRDLPDNRLTVLEGLLDLMEEVRHLHLGRELPLSIALGHLLKYKLGLMKQPITKIEVSKVKSVSEPEKKPLAKPKVVLRLNPAAEKILDFVKRSSRARAKDIIDEFSVLSERTIKRNLQQLTSRGILKKNSENRAMYYSLRS